MNTDMQKMVSELTAGLNGKIAKCDEIISSGNLCYGMSIVDHTLTVVEANGQLRFGLIENTYLFRHKVNAEKAARRWNANAPSKGCNVTVLAYVDIAKAHKEAAQNVIKTIEDGVAQMAQK